MIKKIFLTLLFLFGAFHAFADRVAVPSGTIRWDNFRDNYFNVQTAELYNFLGAVDGELPATPTFPSLQISGSGNSWLELENNSAWTDVLTWGYGFQGGIPYAIVDGTPARLALYSELAAGDTSVIQDDDPTLASATGKYYSRASGDYFNVVHGVEMFAVAGTRTADETDPVIGDITPSSITHDGTGVSLSATIASVIETNEDDREWSLYDVTAGAIVGGWTTFTGLSITGITIPADQHTYRVDVRCTDLAGNVGTASSSNIVYESEAVVDPDVLYECEDNAASTTVLATHGSNGTLVNVNTANNTSETNCGGTRSFSPVASTTRLVSGALTEASLDDGDFTIQFDYYADATTGFGTGNFVRLIAASTSLILRSDNGSSTAFLLTVGAVEYSITLDEINTAACQTIRVVVDADATNKVVVYQGANESSLVAKYTRTDSITTPNFIASPTISFGGTGTVNQGIYLRNGKIDDVKIWYGVETP